MFRIADDDLEGVLGAVAGTDACAGTQRAQAPPLNRDVIICPP